MGNKLPADDKVIVEELIKDFGHLSEDLASAVHLREATAALRQLGREAAVSDPKLYRRIKKTQEKHSLAGI